MLHRGVHALAVLSDPDLDCIIYGPLDGHQDVNEGGRRWTHFGNGAKDDQASESGAATSTVYSNESWRSNRVRVQNGFSLDDRPPEVQ